MKSIRDKIHLIEDRLEEGASGAEATKLELVLKEYSMQE